MRLVKSLSALIFYLSLADRAAAQLSIQCVTTPADDATCDGTLAAPCVAKITDEAGGGLTGAFRLTYSQPTADVGSDESMCNPANTGVCENYDKTIYVTAAGGVPTDGTDVELSNYGMSNLCDEACLIPSLAAGDFTGVCQDGGVQPSAGCVSAAADADTALCATALISTTANSYESIKEVGTCEVKNSFNDAGKACTYLEPCEVKIFDYSGAADDILEIAYNQPKSSEAVCVGSSCDEYIHTIFAKAITGAPTSTEVELSPTALKALCVGQCLDGTAFSGVCQAAPADCVVAATDEEVCGTELVGSVTFNAAVNPSSTTTEGPTSSSAGLVLTGAVSTLLAFW